MEVLVSFKDNDLNGREREFYTDYSWSGKYFAIFMRYTGTRRKRVQVGEGYATQAEAAKALQELAGKIEKRA